MNAIPLNSVELRPAVPEELPLVNPRYKILVYAAATATLVAAGATLAPWEAARIIGLTMLTGIGYGIVNDLVACRDCIEYFTVGHKYDGKELRNRALYTLNPTLNAIAWGAIASWHVCAVAGSVFAFLARGPIRWAVVKITAAQLTPYLAATVGITFVVAHIFSRLAKDHMANKPWIEYENVPLELQAGWQACNVRNSIGYAVVILGGAALSTAILVARVGLIRL